MQGLPIYKIKVGDPTEEDVAVDFIAVVDDPAIQKNFIAFSAQKPESKIKFEVSSKERRLITGALMLANTPIYRRDQERGEYMVVFEPSEIEKIVKKFGKAGHFNNVNRMHDGSDRPDGIYFFDAQFIDSQRGVKTPACLGEDYPDGSWVVTYYVENDGLWNEIKQGKFIGFSVEGFFELAMKSQAKISDLERCLSEFARCLQA